MATVAAIFDDSVALEKAVSNLQSAGLGDDIVEVNENRDADTAPERTETPNDTGTGTFSSDNDIGGIGVPPIAGAGGLIGGGGSGGTQGTAPILGGFFGRGDGTGLGRLDSLGDDAEPFRLAAQRGGKLIILETNDVNTAVSVLQRAGAQQVYDPR